MSLKGLDSEGTRRFQSKTPVRAVHLGGYIVSDLNVCDIEKSLTL